MAGCHLQLSDFAPMQKALHTLTDIIGLELLLRRHCEAVQLLAHHAS